MFIELAALVFGGVFYVFGEPLVKLVVRVKQARHDKVQQSPQLFKRYEYVSHGLIGYSHLAWSSGLEYRSRGDDCGNGNQAKFSTEH